MREPAGIGTQVQFNGGPEERGKGASAPKRYQRSDDTVPPDRVPPKRKKQGAAGLRRDKVQEVKYTRPPLERGSGRGVSGVRHTTGAVAPPSQMFTSLLPPSPKLTTLPFWDVGSVATVAEEEESGMERGASGRLSNTFPPRAATGSIESVDIKAGGGPVGARHVSVIAPGSGMPPKNIK